MAFDLNSISRSGSVDLPPRIVLHGPQGIGKTTFGAQAPNPIFIPTEDGLAGVSVDTFPLCGSFEEVMEALTAVVDSEYKTIIIDSADWLETLVQNYTCRQDNKAHIEEFGYGKGYTLALQHWRKLLKVLDWFRATKKVTVILICHSEIRRFDSPETEPYDRYFLKLHKSASALLLEWADIVGFANWKTLTTSTKVGFDKSLVRGVGTGTRILHLEELPSHIAKTRYQLPSRIPFTWKDFSEAFQKSQTQTQKKGIS